MTLSRRRGPIAKTGAGSVRDIYLVRSTHRSLGGSVGGARLSHSWNGARPGEKGGEGRPRTWDGRLVRKESILVTLEDDVQGKPLSSTLAAVRAAPAEQMSSGDGPRDAQMGYTLSRSLTTKNSFGRRPGVVGEHSGRA